ncbi:hypothetical protein ACFVVP_39310 [Streptomyces sp. NPDC058128]|uniref:DUF6197 family protein n=1 Tax=Streptomyces sp. NPDC058128 TaxID=3346352 RepID=UPI0036E26FB9
MTTITSAIVLFTDTTLAQAAKLMKDAYRPVWVGPSGEESTGEAVARHMEATIALLDKDGWIRTYDHSADWSKGEDLATDDSMTAEDMLRLLLRLVSDEVGNVPQRNLPTALRHVGEACEHGDTDTAHIATTVLDLIIQARTGSDTARATPWSERQHRTHTDIAFLLTAGARFARAYGPSSAETAATT